MGREAERVAVQTWRTYLHAALLLQAEAATRRSLVMLDTWLDLRIVGENGRPTLTRRQCEVLIGPFGGRWSQRAGVVHYCQLTARDYVHALHVLAMNECPCRELFTRKEARPAAPERAPAAQAGAVVIIVNYRPVRYRG